MLLDREKSMLNVWLPECRSKVWWIALGCHYWKSANSAAARVQIDMDQSSKMFKTTKSTKNPDLVPFLTLWPPGRKKKMGGWPKSLIYWDMGRPIPNRQLSSEQVGLRFTFTCGLALRRSDPKLGADWQWLLLEKSLANKLPMNCKDAHFITLPFSSTWKYRLFSFTSVFLASTYTRMTSLSE